MLSWLPTLCWTPGRKLTPLQAHAAIHAIDLWVVIPAAFGALISGIVVSVFTRWGLFVHWCVIVKLVMTLVVIALSTFGVGRWIEIFLTTGTDATARTLAPAVTTAATGNLFAFLTMTALSIYKPRGTRARAGDTRSRRGPRPTSTMTPRAEPDQ